ncbi:MAG TPA: Crp/Fnr family transcriptional regulator [Ramlibacter sp.]|uniref:Crp/Fnr family transcriptional regulator n=1 Tax=Ramlibacter sp. TaxID=1917967 RepID=UPI002CEAD1E7|nr:Crp/Fnr family transcriptional regulator [Ramlibacter sp.]HVZ42283.1 Crp/Fnr family transcriptional regulator [Ramlibacter sp.]
MPVPASLLAQLPLLASLPQVTTAHLAHHASARAFSKREVVLHKGGEGSALCFLVEGRLQAVDFTVDGREVGLYFVDPGDYFGDVSVIDGQPQPVFVTAVLRSQVVFVPRELIRPILFGNARVAETLCGNLATRLRQNTSQRRILGMSNPIQRVCAQLELLLATSKDGTLWVRNAPTHQELAIMINASRETVTRVFQLLQGRGVVERNGTDLRVDDADFLRDMAAGRAQPER